MDIEAIKSITDSAYRENEYPASLNQTATWRNTLPLKGVKILDATPVFRNTLVKHQALLAAGSELYIGISDAMPYDKDIVNLLRRSGITVLTPSEEPEDIDIVLDCAAAFSSWHPHIGFVELTRSGAEKYKDADKPVFFADNGRIKRIETCLGTGESYFRAMDSLGYNDWRDKRLVIFGSGKVGTGIAAYAHKRGASVSIVTEPGNINGHVSSIAAEIIDFRQPEQVAKTVSDAYAIVTATGVANALGYSTAEAIINSPALLANMGVEDEYGPAIPQERVLMGKMTLNFILEEPTRLKYIDATMALHNEGALYLLQHPEAQGAIEPKPELEEKILDISRRYGCINEELEWI